MSPFYEEVSGFFPACSFICFFGHRLCCWVSSWEQVGEYATRTVELTNRSPAPLFYSISKSRSISSGFLEIPQVCATETALLLSGRLR